jgi:hypothetical protein
MKKVISVVLILILSGGFFHGCKKNPGNPPVLPPAGSMAIDFSNFETGAKGDPSAFLQKGTQTSNWEFAAGVAFIWKTIIYSTLAVPVLSFQQAVNQKPVYLSDKTWQWSYDATILNVSYKARLTGQIGADNVIWKMFITKEGSGGFNDFMWFEGTSNLDGKSGQWILNLSPQSPVAVLQIDWTKTGDSVGSIRFTYIKSGDNFKDSYIEYGLTTGTLNAYYTIHYYDSSWLQFYDLNVEWSTTQHNGRVKCPGHFGTSDWYCWDGTYQNITCP